VTDVELPAVVPSEDLLAINEALENLAAIDAEAAELVKLRFFAGLTQAQIAAAFGVSRRTADKFSSPGRGSTEPCARTKALLERKRFLAQTGRRQRMELISDMSHDRPAPQSGTEGPRHRLREVFVQALTKKSGEDRERYVPKRR
jgi:predicted DNA-binding protein (UPF0251 family)